MIPMLIVEAVKDKRLRGAPFTVLCYLHSELEYEEYRSIKHWAVADVLGVTRQCVSQAMRLLVERGYIREGVSSTRKIGSYRLLGSRGNEIDQSPPSARSRRTASRERVRLLREGSLMCAICGRIDVDMHHIIPVAAGGLDELSNIVPLCTTHHAQAHRQHPVSRPWRGPRTREELLRDMLLASVA